MQDRQVGGNLIFKSMVSVLSEDFGDECQGRQRTGYLRARETYSRAVNDGSIKPGKGG